MCLFEGQSEFFGKEKILAQKRHSAAQNDAEGTGAKGIGRASLRILRQAGRSLREGRVEKREFSVPGIVGSGLSAASFFHEMLAVTFWIMDKEISGGKKKVLHSLHENYFRDYSALDKSPEERNKALLEKYSRYDDTWNEVTGHLDEFGLCVVQNICGKEESDRTRERTFWITSYADDISKHFSSIRKSCRQIMSRS